MRITLADEVLLLAYDDEGSAMLGYPTLGFAVAGAVLVELALAGRVQAVDDRVTVVDQRPTGDPVLDDALSQIAAEDKPRKPTEWVSRLSGDLPQRLLDRLVDAGVLRREKDKVLWVFPRTRYPSPIGEQPPSEVDARERLRAAVASDGPVEPRTAALCALVRVGDLRAVAFPDGPSKEVDRRLDEIAEGDWAAEAVKRSIAKTQAAIMTTVMITTTNSVLMSNNS